MHSQTAPDIRNAPIALWRIAATFLNVLHALFGAPEDVAREHTLTRKAHTLMNSWIRAGEAMLRRLLLIEAAALKHAVTHTHTLAGARLAATGRHGCVSPASFAADEPKSWPVSFRCLLDRRRLAGGAARRPRREARFRSAWPLAKRYEAMLRVFDAPLPYARRLARRLNAQPRRAGELLNAPPEYEHRVDQAATFNEEAERARRSWDSS